MHIIQYSQTDSIPVCGNNYENVRQSNGWTVVSDSKQAGTNKHEQQWPCYSHCQIANTSKFCLPFGSLYELYVSCCICSNLSIIGFNTNVSKDGAGIMYP